MKSDSINSYEQKSWEFAVKMHSLLKEFLKNSTEYTPQSLKLHWEKKIRYLEEKYPTLSK